MRSGLRAGDGVAAVLPNGTELLSLYFAAMQAGWYLTPINHHLVGPEIAYIVNDCDAAALVVDERFAAEAAVAAGRSALAERATLLGRRRRRLPTARRS